MNDTTLVETSLEENTVQGKSAKSPKPEISEDQKLLKSLGEMTLRKQGQWAVLERLGLLGVHYSLPE